MRAREEPASPPTRSQLLFSLAYSMVPLLGFWLVEKHWTSKYGEIAGLKAGIVAALILAVAEVAWFYVRERRWEMFAVWSAVLVIAMGTISWNMHSSVVLRLKPAVFEAVFAAIFLGSSMLKKPFMLIMAKRQMRNVAFNDLQLRYFNGINWRLGLLFLLHTALTVYAALWMSMDGWAFVSGALFYILFFVYFLGEFCYARLVFRRKLAEYYAGQRAFLDCQRAWIEQVRRPKK